MHWAELQVIYLGTKARACSDGIEGFSLNNRVQKPYVRMGVWGSLPADVAHEHEHERMGMNVSMKKLSCRSTRG